MSSTSPGISIHDSVATSCAMSPIGNSGARSSGPTGSFVAGCSGGCNGAGRSGNALYQAVGSCDCGRSNRAMGVLLGLAAHHRGCDQRRGEGAGIRGPDERLADEQRVEPGRGHARGVLRRADRALGHGDRRRREVRGERRPRRRGPRRRCRGRGRSRPRSAAPSATARSTSSASCASTSTPSPRPAASSGEVLHVGVVRERGEDQEDRVGADGPGLVDLDLVDREVLAQHRAPRTASRAAWRSATEPPKYGASVSTLSAVAPPAAYSLARIAASRSGARSPFDGERRLISATRPGWPSSRRSAAGEVARRAARRAPGRAAARGSAAGAAR